MEYLTETIWLTIVWISLTKSFNIIDLLLGFFVIFISISITRILFGQRKYIKNISLFTFLKFLGTLSILIFTEGMKNIYLIFTNKAQAKIIDIETSLDTDFKVFLLAASITLTPGTIAINKNGHTLTILTLFPLPDDKKSAQELVKGPFEKILLGGK